MLFFFSAWCFTSIFLLLRSRRRREWNNCFYYSFLSFSITFNCALKNVILISRWKDIKEQVNYSFISYYHQHHQNIIRTLLWLSFLVVIKYFLLEKKGRRRRINNFLKSGNLCLILKKKGKISNNFIFFCWNCGFNLAIRFPSDGGRLITSGRRWCVCCSCCSIRGLRRWRREVAGGAIRWGVSDDCC